MHLRASIVALASVQREPTMSPHCRSEGRGAVKLLRTIYWILRAEWPLFTLLAAGSVLLLAVGHKLMWW
jgi:hypothetical protein